MPPAPRSERWAALAREPFDLLIVGGGVVGAGTARDAALRGLKVALVERDDFASGTSSRSSRLIHGGLRYLEHGHLRLVFESSIERYRLRHLAPHLVRPLAFTWPVYRGARVQRWKLALGLALYDALSLFRNFQGYRGMGIKALLAQEPRLQPEALRGGAVYYDAATDDARLTFVNALGALEAGATVLNHAQVVALRQEEGRTCGALVQDTLTGSQVEVRARVVVNATGPWSDALRLLDSSDQAGHSLKGSKGVHISVPRQRVGNKEALTLLSPVDGRVMFVLPAGAHAIIGTTETPTQSSPDQVRASEADVAYLLESTNAFFPAAQLTRQDVVSAWAGIRPLIAQGYGKHADANSASREHALHRSASGVLAISGGKLTTYRVMAEDVVDEVERLLRRPHHKALTAQLPLPGGEAGWASVDPRPLEAAGFSPESALHLVHTYGARWPQIEALIREQPSLRAPWVEGLPYLRAEIVHGVRSELVHTLADLLVRRSKVAFETRDQGREAARVAAELMALEGGWSQETQAAALSAYESEVLRLFSVDPLPL